MERPVRSGRGEGGGWGEGIKFWKPYRVEYSMIEVARWVRMFSSRRQSGGLETIFQTSQRILPTPLLSYQTDSEMKT